jgi:dephospho-CoA kinase
MVLIGVTGGIGSGKSTVCSLFAKKNVPIFYADPVAKEIADTAAFDEIVAEFGPEILLSASVIDRKKLAAVVFNDPEKLEILNEIIHPKVFDVFRRWKETLPAETKFALVEAALLFESGMFEMMHYVLAVMADEPHRVQRTMSRDATDENSVRSRMKNQISTEELLELSDFQVNNNGSLEDLTAKVNFFSILFSTLTIPME